MSNRITTRACVCMCESECGYAPVQRHLNQQVIVTHCELSKRIVYMYTFSYVLVIYICDMWNVDTYSEISIINCTSHFGTVKQQNGKTCFCLLCSELPRRTGTYTFLIKSFAQNTNMLIEENF